MSLGASLDVRFLPFLSAPSLSLLALLFPCFYLFVGGVSAHLEDRGHVIVCFLLLTCGSWRANSGHQTWQQVSYPLCHLARPEGVCFVLWVSHNPG